MTHARRPPAGLRPALPVLLTLFAALWLPLSAQRAPALAGAEVRTGLVFPEAAVVAPIALVEADLGWIWRPQLRLIAGVSHFRANIDREPGDDEGSFRATGFWLGGRYDLLPLRTIGGYVRGAVTVHSVDADAWDTDVGALLTGTSAGAALAVGARHVLDTTGRLSATVELRRTLMNNIGSTALEIGLRYQRRGVMAYAPARVALQPLYERPVWDTRPPAGTPRQPAPATDTAAARRLAEAWRETAAEPAAEPVPAQTPATEERRGPAPDVAAADVAADIAAERAAAAQALLRQGLNRAAAAMATVSNVRETPASFVVTVGGTAFPSGAASLAAAARSELRVLATVLAGYPGHIISIEGHTDAVGNAAANHALSVERASAVRAALIVEGVDPLWIGVRGFGQDRPVASNDIASGRAANRRVEIRIERLPCPAPPQAAADGALVCPASRSR